MGKSTNAQKLIDEVNSKLDKWNERSQFTLKGIGNLSRSDMDDIKMYCEVYISNDGYSFGGYREPIGTLEEVLKAYGVLS